MKVNYSYIESLIETAEKHEVEEYQFYRDRGRKLTIKQLELILLKSGIELPKDLTPKLSKSELKKIGISEDLIRISVGIEDLDDILNDINSAIFKAFK